MNIKTLNLTGAVVAVVFLSSAAAVFATRLAGKPNIGWWIGLIEFVLAVPLVWLLIEARGRPVLYYVQIGLILLWLAVELLLDYILKTDFRQTMSILVPYVVLFFAAGGGLIGIAALAGTGWTITSIVLYLAAAVLAFVQRFVTEI